ncbi:hypothetical protein HK104_004821, partial [Borealophlyctis nickersoniae]
MATPPIAAHDHPLSTAAPLTCLDVEHALRTAKAQRKQQKSVERGRGSGTPPPSRPVEGMALAAGAEERVVHEIRPGDTLEGICVMYGVE